MTANPNGANPQRLGRNDYPLCDNSHDYDPELREWDGGKMDRFVTESLDYERSDDTRSPSTYGHVAAGVTGGVTASNCTTPLPGHTADQATNTEVMDYYDGNTVTALWNYAQRFSMSDNFFDATFGPSTPGALNLVSGQTHGATPAVLAGVADNGTDYGDADPTYDECSAGSPIAMSGTNIGSELNAQHITWGWFQGGFTPTSQVNGTVVCGASHTNVGGATVTDYSAHHNPFEYYASTANRAHLPPTTEAEIGHNGQANHQYDLSYFYQSLIDGNLPAVSLVKAARYQDGHAG
jgi:phospholipase C